MSNVNTSRNLGVWFPEVIATYFNVNHADYETDIVKKCYDIKNKLNLTDIEFIRVLDDLIDILIDRNIIHFTDFPGSDKKNFIHTLD